MTDWESRYQSQDTPWEKGAPSPGLVEYFETNPPLDGNILVPGCGSGNDVRAISNSANEVTGLDIAPSAIKKAESFSRRGRETYRLENLFGLPAGMRATFDWVIEHTCFCAIDPSMRRSYVEAVSGALKPGGHLLAIFYLNPGTADENEGPPFGVTLPQLDTFFSDSFQLIREWLPTRAYPGREGREWMRLLKKKS